jgi:hypothetical protein
MTAAVRYKLAVTLMTIAGACYILVVIGAIIVSTGLVLAGLRTGTAFLALALTISRSR